jgi:hypothetical protein
VKVICRRIDLRRAVEGVDKDGYDTRVVVGYKHQGSHNHQQEKKQCVKDRLLSDDTRQVFGG